MKDKPKDLPTRLTDSDLYWIREIAENRELTKKEALRQLWLKLEGTEPPKRQ